MPNENRRALRRHQNARYLARAKRIATQWAFLPAEETEWIERTARLIRDNRKPCSCHMCRNGRRSPYARGLGLLTIQERRRHEADLFNAPME
jgi:hypothetical protein